jgi:hypothetical protein
MNRKLWTTLIEIAGFLIVIVGVANFSVPVGVILFGAGLIAVGGLSA